MKDATPQQKLNLVIIISLFLAFGTLVVALRFVPADQTREIFMLLSAIIAAAGAALNNQHANPPPDNGTEVKANRVENITLTPPPVPDDRTQELPNLKEL